MSKRVRGLVGGALVRGTVLNVLGLAFPLLAALFTFPRLIAELGTVRFGALSIAWTLTGYANIFDFGLGRALTLLVARALGRGDRSEVNPTAWTALLVSLGTGLLATLILHVLAAPIVDSVLRLDGPIRDETLRALHLISYFLPVVILVTGLRGLLEAYRLFGVTNLIRTPFGVLNYLVPLAIASRLAQLEPVVLGVVLVRCLEVICYFAAARWLLDDFTSRIRVSLDRLKALFRFGTWMTVSNLIAPIMLNFDRFFIASLTTLGDVTYYVTPQTVVTRMRIVPTAVMSVLFPSFSSLAATQPQQTKRLYRQSIRSIALLMGPLSLAAVLFAKPGLTLWVGPEIAEKSYRVAQYLAIGVFIHSLGQTPFTLLQALGRAAATAQVHLAEVPLYVLYLYLLVRSMGIEGAGLAWLIRVTLSTTVLMVLANRTFRGRERVGGSPVMES